MLIKSLICEEKDSPLKLKKNSYKLKKIPNNKVSQ